MSKRPTKEKLIYNTLKIKKFRKFGNAKALCKVRVKRPGDLSEQYELIKLSSVSSYSIVIKQSCCNGIWQWMKHGSIISNWSPVDSQSSGLQWNVKDKCKTWSKRKLPFISILLNGHCLLVYLKPEIRSGSHFFILFIPLRQKYEYSSPIRNNLPVIISSYTAHYVGLPIKEERLCIWSQVKWINLV